MIYDLKKHWYFLPIVGLLIWFFVKHLHNGGTKSGTALQVIPSWAPAVPLISNIANGVNQIGVSGANGGAGSSPSRPIEYNLTLPVMTQSIHKLPNRT